MRNHLKTLPNWDTTYVTQDLIELIKATKSLCYKYEGHRHPVMALVRAKSRVFTLFQGSMYDANFMECFNAQCAVVEQQGGQFSEAGLVTKKMLDKGTDTTDAVAVAAVMGEISSSVKACLFINNLNQERHGEFKRGLANSYASGADNYPKDVGKALLRAVNYLKIQPTKAAQQQSGDGLTFVQRKGSRGGGNNYDRKESGDTD